MKKKISMEKKIKDSVKWKAHKIIDAFEGNIKHCVSHCLEMLDTLHSTKAKFSVIEFYQDVLFYLTRVYEHNDGRAEWGICPVCDGYKNHSRKCVLSLYEENKSHKANYYFEKMYQQK